MQNTSTIDKKYIYNVYTCNSCFVRIILSILPTLRERTGDAKKKLGDILYVHTHLIECIIISFKLKGKPNKSFQKISLKKS